jgi:hypothetical protein
MYDVGRRARVDRPATAQRMSAWALAVLAGVAACGADAAPCVCPTAAPPVASRVAAPVPDTEAVPRVVVKKAQSLEDDLWAARRPLALGSASAGLALDTAENLFRGRFEPVRRLLQFELGEELTIAKLHGIVDGLVKAHGPPVEVMDAWASEIREKEVVSPAAEALIRMQSGKRIGLLLVFDPQGAVRGLWLRPI